MLRVPDQNGVSQAPDQNGVSQAWDIPFWSETLDVVTRYPHYTEPLNLRRHKANIWRYVTVLVLTP